MIDLRPLNDSDRAWAYHLETESWSEPVVARLGELIDPTQLPGFIVLWSQIEQFQTGQVSQRDGGPGPAPSARSPVRT